MQPCEASEAACARRLDGRAEPPDDCFRCGQRNARGLVRPTLHQSTWTLNGTNDKSPAAAADRRGRGHVLAARTNAAEPRRSGAVVAPGLLRLLARPARRRGADAARGRALLGPHDAARHHRRPRGAGLRHRPDGPAPQAAARDRLVLAPPRPRPSAGCAAAVGGEPLSLARPALLRRRAQPRRSARARAHLLLHRGRLDVGRGRGGPAGPRVVRDGREVRLRRRRPARRDRPRKRLHLVRHGRLRHLRHRRHAPRGHARSKTRASPGRS